MKYQPYFRENKRFYESHVVFLTICKYYKYFHVENVTNSNLISGYLWFTKPKIQVIEWLNLTTNKTYQFFIGKLHNNLPLVQSQFYCLFNSYVNAKCWQRDFAKSYHIKGAAPWVILMTLWILFIDKNNSQ